MSDQPNANANAKAAADAKTKPAGPPLVMLLGIAVGALAVGGAAGALVIGPQVVAMQRAAADSSATHKAGKSDGKKGEKEETRPVMRIDNVIVNPAGSQGSRFLLTSVAIELPDSKSQDRLRAREAEVRDRVISILQRRSLEQIAAPGSRDSVKRDLTDALQPMVPEGPIHIFLPQFVIQ